MSPNISIPGSSKNRPWGEGPSTTVKGKKKDQNDAEAQDESSPDELQLLAQPDRTAKDFLELAGGGHPQWETISTTTASSKTGAKRPRIKPEAKENPHIPYARMETILNSDPSHGNLSKEAVFVVLCATEDFIRRLTRAAKTRADIDNRATTMYKDVADTAHYFHEYNFLEDMIPRVQPLKEALAQRKRILEKPDPILDGGAVEESAQEVPKPEEAAGASSAKGKGKAKATNGRATKPTSNGFASTIESVASATGRERQKPKRARTIYDVETADAGESISTGSRRPSKSRSKSTSTTASANGAGNGGAQGAMKIKIKPRSGTSSERPSVLALGPPADILSRRSHGSTSRMNGKNNQTKAEEGDDGNDLVFAPVGASDAPLWTRVPLPPPPSPRTRHSSHSHSTANATQNGNGSSARQHSSRRTSSASLLSLGGQGEGGPDFRGALSPNAPNPGRTIYSQR